MQYIHTYKTQPGVPSIPEVKNVIAVASGKGGVGKSTTAVHLALNLQALNARVGILDADIYGPSIPLMLGCTEKPKVEDNYFIPVIRHGLQAMSIGYLVEEQPFAWRGPMVSKALQQLFFETRWSSLDFLIVDLPPGTGDIQLTLAQKIPVAGAIVVTTPQEIALIDARKALKMFQKVNISVLGVIENMSGFVCSNCDTLHTIFGAEGGCRLASAFDTEFLGRVPLDIHLRSGLDQGIPTPLNDTLSKCYKEIAQRVMNALSKKERDYRKPIATLSPIESSESPVENRESPIKSSESPIESRESPIEISE